ncbi:MAG: glycosyltransferase family 2 protein [Lentimicrobiaceae bacterium]|jgi:GT2 family glycosyltransferase|nr:glycosyltransferase family 2 protein [Lentimicrobiaceae bacterium]MDD4598048.1 glycosyltransferase family 2 protein [Lentimicrobiaceae bacterium]
MKHIHIAILLPIHNGLDFTRKCLKNLEDNLSHPAVNRNDFTLVVIDDGSTDGSAQWIENHYAETVILKGDGTLWWSGGINRGIDYAISQSGTSHMLMWNNDILIEKDYLYKLFNVLNRFPANTIIGSKIYFADCPDTIWAMGGIFNQRTGYKDMFGTSQKDSAIYNTPFEADWLPGMGTLIPRQVIEDIGFMDDRNFPQYHGDSDFTLRAKISGYRIVALPELRIWNDKSNSGVHHQNNFRMLIRSLHDIRSNYHIGKDIRFYSKYAGSPLAYQAIFKKYVRYLGGFLKWKILKFAGLEKKNTSKHKQC